MRYCIVYDIYNGIESSINKKIEELESDGYIAELHGNLTFFNSGGRQMVSAVISYGVTETIQTVTLPDGTTVEISKTNGEADEKSDDKPSDDANDGNDAKKEKTAKTDK